MMITGTDIKNLPMSLYSKVRLWILTQKHWHFVFCHWPLFQGGCWGLFAHCSLLQLLSRLASCPSNEVGGFEHEQPLFCICTTGYKSCMAENSCNSAWQQVWWTSRPTHNHSQKSKPSILCLFKWHVKWRITFQSEVNKVFIDLIQCVIWHCFWQ